MAGIKQLKSWFFQATSVLRADGTTGGVRLRKTDKPTQQTLENLLESTTFKTESGDRAKVSTGATIGSEQGLVVLASNTQAKANTAQLGDRSLVVQPHQLPTVEPLANAAISDMPTTVMETAADGTATRNNFAVRPSDTWITWLVSRLFKTGGTANQVPIKTNGTDYNWSWGSITSSIISDFTAAVTSVVGGLSIASGSNVGGGSEVYKSTASNVLSFRTLLATNKYGSNALPFDVIDLTENANDITANLNWAALATLQDEQFITMSASGDTDDFPVLVDNYPDGAAVETMQNVTTDALKVPNGATFKIEPKPYTAVIPDVTSVRYKVEFSATVTNPSAGTDYGNLIVAIAESNFVNGDPYVTGAIELTNTGATPPVNTSTMYVAGTLNLDGTGSRYITIYVGKQEAPNFKLYNAFLTIRAISLNSTSLGTVKIL